MNNNERLTRDMEEAGYEVRNYHGRFHYEGPAVTVEGYERGRFYEAGEIVRVVNSYAKAKRLVGKSYEHVTGITWCEYYENKKRKKWMTIKQYEEVMTDSQVIHEAMNLCWHEWKGGPMLGGVYEHIPYECTKCGIKHEWWVYHTCPAFGNCKAPENPDYSSDAQFLPLWRWAKEQGWWDRFLLHYLDSVGLEKWDDMLWTPPLWVAQKTVELVNNSTFAHEIAEFIRRTNETKSPKR